MASRRQQREQARAARLAREQELAARARRSRRRQLLFGSVAAALIVIAVVITISSRGGSSQAPGLQGGAKLASVQRGVDTLLNDIPEHGTVLGSPTANVELVYFGDLECPICRGFTLDGLPSFISSYVRTGKVQVDYKSLCTATCGGAFSVSQSEAFFDRQQVAAYAAGSQGKFWYYAEFFYHEQREEDTGYATDSYLLALAKQVRGLDIQKWQTDRGDPTLLAQVGADQRLASHSGFDSTPTLIMEGPKGDTEVPSEPGSWPHYGDLVSAYKTVI